MLLVPLVIAVYLTSVSCRRKVSRGRQPSFLPAIVTTLCGPVIVTVVVALFVERSAVFTRRYWQGDSTGQPALYFLLYMAACTAITLLPTLGVVLFYRRKIK